ncbi:MAG: VWA domain-containing protein [Planctomycetota bacterium]
MKLALILNGINPRIGGVLISGMKGSGKSSAARALAALLPKTPFVHLPLGATEDRVIGTLDIEKALKKGKKHFEPGLLKRAHNGVLYVDEVNLLPDHLVDILLDVAVSGVNVVEREGVSVKHPSRFILVGTMNPEEGELRPQLLDRFGLSVGVEAMDNSDDRVEVVRRAVAAEADPVAFARRWKKEEDTLRARIQRARKLLPKVKVSGDVASLISEICRRENVEGLRADIVIHRAAMTVAAWEGRTEVIEADVHQVAELALAHRRNAPPEQPAPPPRPKQRDRQDPGQGDASSPPPSPPPKRGRDQEAGSHTSNQGRDQEAGSQSSNQGRDQETGSHSSDQDRDQDGGEPSEELAPQAPNDFRLIKAPQDKPKIRQRISPGYRGGKNETGTRRGPTVGSRFPQGKVRDISLEASLRAAAQRGCRLTAQGLALQTGDLREKVRRTPVSRLFLFVVDASRSMGAHQRMQATKGALIGLLEEAYQKRDEVALIIFQGEKARVVLEPTRSVRRVQKLVRDMPVGGRTPLAAALHLAQTVLVRARRKRASLVPSLVLVSDGRPTLGRGGLDPVASAEKELAALERSGLSMLMVDTEEGYIRLGLMKEWSGKAGTPCVTLDDLQRRGARRLLKAG